MVWEVYFLLDVLILEHHIYRKKDLARERTASFDKNLFIKVLNLTIPSPPTKKKYTEVSNKEKDINSFNYLQGIFNFKKNHFKKAENYLKKVENDDKLSISGSSF